MNNYDDIKRFKEKLNLESIDYKEIVESHPNNTANNWAIIKQVATADEPFHPLEHGHSTQPTPTPVSHQEFSASSFAQSEPVLTPFRRHQDQGILDALAEPTATGPAREQTFASPLLSAISKVMPPPADASGLAVNAGNFSLQRPSNTLRNALENQPTAQPAVMPESKSRVGSALFDIANRQDFAPAASVPTRAPMAPQTSLPAQSNIPSQASSPTQPENAKRFTTLFNRKSHLPAGTTPTRDMSLSLLLENIALCR
jgi:hypothetical protein